ncbi:MAG: DUF5131 family protein, partial [Tabrizicola sp.]|nr:DUF5131 family protein [Tabrizicola sp.]
AYMTARRDRRDRISEACGVDDWPLPNCWLGVSCEDQATADERIPLLLQTPAAVRFVSAEPLLGPIVFDQQVHLERRTKILTGASAPRIDWVIVGGESGPKARPCDVAWIRSIVQQCKAAAVPVFVKQDSGPRPGMRGRIPEDLWMREFPR